MPAAVWFYPLPKAIPTVHPSALPKRRWGGGGWREEGSSGTIQRGLVMVTQRWPDSALFPACWEHRCTLGWDFHPPLNHFSIIPCLPQALRPTRTLSCPSLGVFWGCTSLGTFWGVGTRMFIPELLKSGFLPAPRLLRLCPRRTLV